MNASRERPDRAQRTLRSRLRRATRSVVGLAAVAALGCTPRARPLAGVAAPPSAQLPRLELPRQHQRVVFRWRYEEQDGPSARGEGVARIAPPDSARLDFFLEGGFAGGRAMLYGNTLSVPGGALVERVVPPAPLLWAAFGRLALPPASDTTIRVSGDTLRADIGSGRIYRLTIIGDRLARLDRIEDGRLVEGLSRDSSVIRYRNEAARRSLTITISRTEPADVFPATIWTR